MRTVSVSRSGKGNAPGLSATGCTLRPAVGLAKALQHLQLPGEGARVGDVETGAHLAREANHAGRRIVEEPEALGAVVRHDRRRLLEIDFRKRTQALAQLRVALEGASQPWPFLIRQRRPLPRL